MKVEVGDVNGTAATIIGSNWEASPSPPPLLWRMVAARRQGAEQESLWE